MPQGYHQSKAYIIIQSPMADTVKEFWKMIIETQCSTIVMLCDLVENNQVGLLINALYTTCYVIISGGVLLLLAMARWH